jgi:hypothetical protein
VATDLLLVDLPLCISTKLEHSTGLRTVTTNRHRSTDWSRFVSFLDAQPCGRLPVQRDVFTGAHFNMESMNENLGGSSWFVRRRNVSTRDLESTALPQER